MRTLLSCQNFMWIMTLNILLNDIKEVCIYSASRPDLWPPLDRQGCTFCTTNHIVVPNKLKMRAEVCMCQEILTVNIWPARKWSGEKRGIKELLIHMQSHTQSHSLSYCHRDVEELMKEQRGRSGLSLDSHLFPVLLCRRKQGPRTICNFLSEKRKKITLICK